MTARAASKELKRLREEIDKPESLNALVTPPIWDGQELKRVSRFLAEALHSSLQQLAAWKNLLSWEKTNPLQREDPSTRAIYIYRQALLSMRFYPEIW